VSSDFTSDLISILTSSCFISSVMKLGFNEIEKFIRHSLIVYILGTLESIMRIEQEDTTMALLLCP